MSEHLNVGDVFRRKRGFRRPPDGYPQDAWWSSSLNPAIAEGWECLEVVEIVTTATFGRLAIYREWWIDPDGKEVTPTQSWIPDKGTAATRAERNMLRSLAQKKMEAVGRVAKEVVPARTADKPKGEHRLDLGSMHMLGTA
jgi:hypothetical protein